MPVDEEGLEDEDILDFKIDARSTAKPIVFRLMVTRTTEDGDKEESYTFHAKREPGMNGLQAMAAVAWVDPRTNERHNNPAGLIQFFNSILPDAEFEVLYQITRDKNLTVRGEDLTEVFGGLAEIYGANQFGDIRPTSPSGGSAPPGLSTGQPSRAQRRSTAKT